MYACLYEAMYQLLLNKFIQVSRLSVPFGSEVPHVLFMKSFIQDTVLMFFVRSKYVEGF